MVFKKIGQLDPKLKFENLFISFIILYIVKNNFLILNFILTAPKILFLTVIKDTAGFL